MCGSRRSSAGRGFIAVTGAVVGAVWVGAAADAAIIQFTYTSTGGGTLGGTSFGPAGFVIIAYADTADRLDFGVVIHSPHRSASITIEGHGVANFITATRSIVNHETQGAGLARGMSDIMWTVHDPVFASWDMLTTIGPITGTGWIMQWEREPVMTDRGILRFDESVPQVTFQATIIPTQPTTLALAGGLFIASRRRRAASNQPA